MKFKELFFKENYVFVQNYVSLKKEQKLKKDEVNKLTIKYHELMSSYSTKIREKLSLPTKEEELRIIESNLKSSKTFFYSDTYSKFLKKTNLIEEFYNNSTELKTNLGYNLFQTMIQNELESL